MKKIIDFGFILSILLLTACSNSNYHRANYDYNNMAYYKAAKNYSVYLKKHDRPQAVSRLAQCYYKMHDYDNAEYWYSKVVALPAVKPADQLAYAMVLKTNGKYPEAKQWFAKYLDAVPADPMATALMTSCDSVNAYNKNAGAYDVEPLSINTKINKFGMTPFEVGYVFCSEQPITPGTKASKINPWNGHSYLDILYSRVLPDGSFGTPVSFSATLNSPYHNGPVTFAPNNDRVYFSRSNYMNNKRYKNADHVNNLKIYTARREGNDWADITELPFNSKDFSCSHPALSANGDTMFFISDKPGGYGNTDIYISVNRNGKWSEPQNLGAGINTPGYEMFPYYYRDSAGHAYLYFSSDGLPGMGGLDLYYTMQQTDGTWGAPVHMDAPFNSSKDDFSITFNADGTTGYLSSSRDENLDKLFAFNKAINLFADGEVYNKETNERLSAASVEVNNTTTGKKDVIITDADGKFFIPLEKNADYVFNASKEKFIAGSAFTSTAGKKVSETIHIRIGLEPELEVITRKAYTGELPRPFTNIYYDFDKWYIRPDASYQLDKIFERMLYNPELRLVISAHADSRGSVQYNMALTKKRAISAMKYLTSRGISRDRLTIKWYGKSRPVNECVTGVKCSPEKHQENRRAEFAPIKNH